MTGGSIRRRRNSNSCSRNLVSIAPPLNTLNIRCTSFCLAILQSVKIILFNIVTLSKSTISYCLCSRNLVSRAPPWNVLPQSFSVYLSFNLLSCETHLLSQTGSIRPFLFWSNIAILIWLMSPQFYSHSTNFQNFYHGKTFSQIQKQALTFFLK